jgi:hypothetical protein
MFGKRNRVEERPAMPRRRLADRVASLPPVPAEPEPIAEPVKHKPLSARVLSVLKDAYPEVGATSLPLMLNAIGALAGFSTQQGIWHAIKSGSLEEIDRPARTTLSDGCICYRGRTLQRMVVGTDRLRASIWSLVSSGAQNAGSSREGLPDIAEMVAMSPWGKGVSMPEGPPTLARHIAQLRGRGSSTVPLREAEQPIAVLGKLWPQILPILQDSAVEPIKWGTEFATLAQRHIVASKARLAPSVAARLVMEPAIVMAGIDPTLVPGAPYDDDLKHLGDRIAI